MDDTSKRKGYPGSGTKSQSRRSFRTPIQTIPLTTADGRSASKSFVVGPDQWDFETPRSNIEGLLSVADTQSAAASSVTKTPQEQDVTPSVDKTFKVPQSSSGISTKTAARGPTATLGSTPGSKFTPRTNIWNLMHIVQHADQTPAERTTSDMSEPHSRESGPSILKQKGWGQEVTLSPMYPSRTSEGKVDSPSFGRKSYKRTRRSFHIPVPQDADPEEEISLDENAGEKDNVLPGQHSAELNESDKRALTVSLERIDEVDLENGVTKLVSDGQGSRSSSRAASTAGSKEDVVFAADIHQQERTADVEEELAVGEFGSYIDNTGTDVPNQMVEEEELASGEIILRQEENRGESQLVLSRSHRSDVIASGSSTVDGGDGIVGGESLTVQVRNDRGVDTINKSTAVLNEDEVNENNDEEGAAENQDLGGNDTLLSIRLEKGSAASPRNLKHPPTPDTPNRSVYDLSEGSTSSGDLELFELRSTAKSDSKTKKRLSGNESALKTPRSAYRSVSSASRSGKHRLDSSPANSSSKRPRLSYSEWKSHQMERGEGKSLATPRHLRAPRSSTPTDRSKRILHSTKIQSSILAHLSHDPANLSGETSGVGQIPDFSPIRPDTRNARQTRAESLQEPADMDVNHGEESHSMHAKTADGQARKTGLDLESSDDELPEGISHMKTPNIDMNKRPRSLTVQKQGSRRIISKVGSKSPTKRKNTEDKTHKGGKQPAKRTQKLPATALTRSSLKFFAQRHSMMKLSKDAIEEIEKVSEIFWDDTCKALEAYTLHGGRKIVNEQDVILLMKTQRLIKGTEDLHDRIRELLPMELRAELIPMAKP